MISLFGFCFGLFALFVLLELLLPCVVVFHLARLFPIT